MNVESRGYIQGWGLRLTADAHRLDGSAQRDSRDMYACADRKCPVYYGATVTHAGHEVLIREHARPAHFYIWRRSAASGLLFLREEENGVSTNVWYFLQHPEKGNFFLRRTSAPHHHVHLAVVPAGEVPPDLREMLRLFP